MVDDPLPFRRHLANLKGAVSQIVGVDVDPIVRENPSLDEAHVITAGQPLPFGDEYFDLILSDHAFEHVNDPTSVAAELDRVLRPGGWICARTPNRAGYIALGARLIPSSLHASVLSRVQPGRREVDVFPKCYRLNTRRALRRHFPPDRFEHCVFGINAEPTYVGNSRVLWAALWVWFQIAPEALSATWLVFLRKLPAARC